GRHRRARRHLVHGLAGREPAALLPPRIVRQVHAVPGRHRLAAQDSSPHRARGRAAAGPGSAAKRVLEYCRQDALRVRRRGGDAGADHLETFPARVRGPHQGTALHAAGRMAGAADRGGALMTSLLLAQIALTLFVFFMLLNSAAVMVYVERKVAALLQQRLGPYLVGPEGVLQPLADVVKLMFKEELRPRAADPLLFALAPIISATAAFAAFAVVPFGAETTLFGLLDDPLRLQVADVDVAVLVVFAIASMSVYGIVLAGWSSNSKYSLLGGLRSSAQMISYELSYGLALASVLLLGNSLSLRTIVDAQSGTWWGFIPRWNVFFLPTGFIAFVIY